MTHIPQPCPPYRPIESIPTSPPHGSVPSDHEPAPRECDAALVELLNSHEGRDAEMLSTYVRAWRSCDDAGDRLLLQMLLDDECQHHLQLAGLLNNLESFAADRPVSPRLSLVGAQIDEELLATSHNLLEREREDARELKDLKQVRKSADMPKFYALLIRLMEYDTAKKIAILEFINGQHASPHPQR
jgi:hypothetical protein